MTLEPGVRVGTHEIVAPLFEVLYFGQRHDYDVSLDGKRFLFMKPLEAQSSQNQIQVVLGWAEELRGRLPRGRK